MEIDILKILAQFGPGTLLIGGFFYMLYSSFQNSLKEIRAEREALVKEIRENQAQMKEYMSEIRRMYENNVHLVEDFQEYAGGYRDALSLNTQEITRLTETIRHNDYCPLMRPDDKKDIRVQ